MPSMAASGTSIAILEQPVLLGPKTFKLQQHQNSFTGRDYTFSTADGTAVFEIDGAVRDKDMRRTVKDSRTGKLVLELSRQMGHLEGAWYAEHPDPRRKTVASGNMKWSFAHAKVDVKFQNSASAGSDEQVLEIRGKDSTYHETEVFYQGTRVVHIRKTTGTSLPVIPFLNTNKPGHRDEWDVEVMEGVDAGTALLAALIVSDFVTPMIRA